MSTEATRAAYAAISAAITAAQSAVLADYAVADACAASVDADARARGVATLAERSPAGTGDSERTYTYNFAGYAVSRPEAAVAAVKASGAAAVAAAAAYAAHAASIKAYDRALEAMQRASEADADADMDPSYLNAAIEGAIEAARLRYALITNAK